MRWMLISMAVLAPFPLDRAPGADRPAEGKTFSMFENPLKEQGADPWLIHHDGFYYLATTTGIDLKDQKSSAAGRTQACPRYRGLEQK